MKRRTFLAGSVALAVSSRALEAHNTGYSHTHGGSGSSSCDNGIGVEASFDRGSLERMYKMPACVLIIHHASAVPNAEFEIRDMGAETYALWAREDAKIEDVSSTAIGLHLSGRAAISDSNGTKMQVIRQAVTQGVRYAAFLNVAQMLGVRSDVAPNNSVAAHGYEEIRKKLLSDPTAIAIGYRNMSFDGLKPISVNGVQAHIAPQDYVFMTPTFACIRKSSQKGYNRFERWIATLEANRARDAENMASYLART